MYVPQDDKLNQDIFATFQTASNLNPFNEPWWASCPVTPHLWLICPIPRQGIYPQSIPGLSWIACSPLCFFHSRHVSHCNLPRGWEPARAIHLKDRIVESRSSVKIPNIFFWIGATFMSVDLYSHLHSKSAMEGWGWEKLISKYINKSLILCLPYMRIIIATVMPCKELQSAWDAVGAPSSYHNQKSEAGLWRKQQC